MRRKELLKIANMLNKFKDTKKQQFDMDGWKIIPKYSNCGTSCCAIGWAIEKKVTAKTLTLNIDSYGSYVPKYKKYNNLRAVVKYFKITHFEAEYLFISDGYDTTPKAVAKRIRSFVENKTKRR